MQQETAADPTLISSRQVFSHRRAGIEIERWSTADGEIERPVVRLPRCAAVIAQPTPATVVLVRQWRYPVRRWTLEIPAGTCHAGEAPAACARRELIEEAGFTAIALVELFRFTTEHGTGDEEMVLFRASGLTPGRTSPDQGELCMPEIVRLDQLPGLWRSGSIDDAKTILAMAMLGIDLRGC